jgi:NAD(P)-dependent dehydrogenase (short-subunit alcohol dehydrogenase family)
MAISIAIVTGASGGIGGAIARRIHERSEGGLRLALHCNENRSAVEALLGEIPGAFLVQADLAHASGRALLVREVLEQGSPSILVNNAGASEPHEPALSMTEATFSRLIDVNLKAPLFLMQAFGREMARRGSGVIVNIGSVLAHKAIPGAAAYRAAKAALEEVSRQLAMELAPAGIRVNVVSPGLIRTRMTDAISPAVKGRLTAQIALGDLGDPEAVAAAVWHVIENDYMTGSVVTVDGGIGL